MDTARQARPWHLIVWISCVGLGAAAMAGCAVYFLQGWLNDPRWATATGSIVSAQIDSDEKTARRRRREYRYMVYSLDISYRYSVGGREYRSDNIGDGHSANYRSRANALAALADYTRPPVTVYYDPANPERSVLDTWLMRRPILIGGGVGLLLVLLGLSIRRWG